MNSCLSYYNSTGKDCSSFNVRHDGNCCFLKSKRPGDDGVELAMGNWWVMRRPDWYLGKYDDREVILNIHDEWFS